MSATPFTEVTKCDRCGVDFKDNDKIVVILSTYVRTAMRVDEDCNDVPFLGAEMNWDGEIHLHKSCYDEATRNIRLIQG
jgi:hypothetical protein